MKLSVSLPIIASAHNAAFELAQETFPSGRVCGMLSGASGSLGEEVVLDVDEACIYRVEVRDAGIIQINLAEAAQFDCAELSLYMVTENSVEGPFCNEGRHRRGAYNYDSSYGSDNSNHEVDLVYTNNGGMKFNFNFHFDFELLPGLPGGAVQQGYKENAGDYYKPDNKEEPSYGEDEKPNPGYEKPTEAPYKPTKKPYKPPKTTTYTTTTTTTTTTKKYKPPKTTYKATTYKPTTEPYKTKTTYKPTTPKYTTKKPVYTTKKPYTTPYGGGGGNYVTYTPSGKCPWTNSPTGDCEGNEGKCNLKYFRVCGEDFFNRVYNDVCKWQDAKQLIPMFTQKLVPLGQQFEKKFGKTCTGYGSRSILDLIGDESVAALNANERDVASCSAIAGAPPCDLLDFSDVDTARKFHYKMVALFDNWLKKHCNREFQVHFEALLIRMQHSLFCSDGSQPDHAGYTVSEAPPPYNPNKPYDGPTKDPYTTKEPF